MVTLYTLCALVSYLIYSYFKTDKNDKKLIDKHSHRGIIILLVILFATSLSKGDEWMMGKQKEIIDTLMTLFVTDSEGN